MDQKKIIELSETTASQAERRATEGGFDSVDAYVDALIQDDCEFDLNQDWIRKKLDEGLASGNAGEMTREKLHRLVSDGIAQANKRQ